jgi:hypothetical protein
MRLFLPVGLPELEKIVQANCHAFPSPGLGRAGYYPSADFDGAEQMAAETRTEDELSGFAGFVTEFQVEDEYLQRLGGRHGDPEAGWRVPEEELSNFNDAIMGVILISDAFYGSRYRGMLSRTRNFTGLDALAQLNLLTAAATDAGLFSRLLLEDPAVVLANYAYWYQSQPETGILDVIREKWKELYPDWWLLEME